MIKIFLTCRNRLGITKKCIQAIRRHTKLKFQLYVYDNLTNYRIEDNWEYFCSLYRKGILTQYTCNTKQSTFDAFSKAVACNLFGKLHLMDPKRHAYSFLLFLDNDILVLPGWDLVVRAVMQDLEKLNWKHIKAVEQFKDGGIKHGKPHTAPIGGYGAYLGKLGGSGFWAVKPNFFEDVGFLDIKSLVGQDKKHDQTYWRLMDQKSGGKPYILGVKTRMIYHCGGMVGSICNTLTRNRKGNVNFEEQDKMVESLSFEDFLEKARIKNEKPGPK